LSPAPLKNGDRVRFSYNGAEMTGTLFQIELLIAPGRVVVIDTDAGKRVMVETDNVVRED
jgi:hypothetical protein